MFAVTDVLVSKQYCGMAEVEGYNPTFITNCWAGNAEMRG